MIRLGYSVGRNKPYAGGFITEHYGNPASGLHTVQLELNRASTWTSGGAQRGERFGQVTSDFAVLAEVLASFRSTDLGRSRRRLNDRRRRDAIGPPAP